MFGSISCASGGVGGTSPVIRTKASTPAHNSFRAVMGVIVKTSKLFGDPGTISSFCAAIASPASSEGTGAGGGGYEKQSSVSWRGMVSVAVDEVAEECSVNDMAVNIKCVLECIIIVLIWWNCCIR